MTVIKSPVDDSKAGFRVNGVFFSKPKDGGQ